MFGLTINGEFSFQDDSSEHSGRLREDEEVSKPLGRGSIGVDVIETGVIGSPVMGLWKEILLLDVGVSVGPESCGIACRAEARRGLAFNKRENSRANRQSSSTDA